MHQDHEATRRKTYLRYDPDLKHEHHYFVYPPRHYHRHYRHHLRTLLRPAFGTLAGTQGMMRRPKQDDVRRIIFIGGKSTVMIFTAARA